MKTREPFSIPEIRTTYQISYQTASTDIQKLLGMGLIKEYGKVWSKRLYIIANK
jgi:Fic family protein